MLAIIAALLIGGWCGFLVSRASALPAPSDDPILRAQAYALAHYPKEFSPRTEFAFYGRDAGEAWFVEVTIPPTSAEASSF